MTVYYETPELKIRSMEPADAGIIYETYLSYGWHPSLETYENYYRQQETGKRQVFIAQWQGQVAGLCTLMPEPKEGPWAGMGYPEIVDLSVFIAARNQGIGNRLLDVAEAQAAKLADRVCLAVGVHSGYGAAQRIYIQRGYLPDGTGAWYQGKPLEQYAPCCNDDDLLLYLSKSL